MLILVWNMTGLMSFITHYIHLISLWITSSCRSHSDLLIKEGKKSEDEAVAAGICEDLMKIWDVIHTQEGAADSHAPPDEPNPHHLFLTDVWGRWQWRCSSLCSSSWLCVCFFWALWAWDSPDDPGDPVMGIRACWLVCFSSRNSPRSCRERGPSGRCAEASPCTSRPHVSCARTRCRPPSARSRPRSVAGTGRAHGTWWEENGCAL